MEILASKIRMFRALKNLKTKDLAFAIKAHPQTITYWVSQKKTPKVRIHRRIADNLVSYTKGYITLKDCGYEE